MSRIIDDKGRLFGLVNVVDAFVVLVIIAVLVGLAVVVTNDLSRSSKSVNVTAEAAVSDAVVDALESARSVPSEGVLGVGTARVVGKAEPANATQQLAVVRVNVTLSAEWRDGLLYHGGKRLYVARDLRLDLNSTVIDATVVEVHAER